MGIFRNCQIIAALNFYERAYKRAFTAPTLIWLTHTESSFLRKLLKPYNTYLTPESILFPKTYLKEKEKRFQPNLAPT
jgi:hypothetical protein